MSTAPDPRRKVPSPEDAHRAGRFVAAVADGDHAQALDIMREAGDERDLFYFALEMSGISIGVSRYFLGEDWRNGLESMVLQLSMEPFGDDNPQDGEGCSDH